MLVSVLGAVELYDEDEHPVHIGGLRRRAVFAALALEVNRVVGVARLLEIVWDGRPPPQARAALQGHIAVLRRILPPGLAIETRDDGYRLTGDAFRVDSARFADLVARSVREGDDAAASVRFSSALGLWRGEPLSDLLVLGFFRSISGTMSQARARAAELWAWRELRMGTGAGAVPLIQSLVHEDPTRESLISVLMLCLAQDGRRAEALEIFQQARATLHVELGTAPGPLLQDALGRVLRGTDPAAGIKRADSSARPAPTAPAAPTGVTSTGAIPIGATSTGAASSGAASTGAIPTGAPAAPAALGGSSDGPRPEGTSNPHTLPRAHYGFVGRAAQLALLDSLGAESRPRLAVVTGGAGAGKTALLLHWAHRAAERFPDGRLYADLGGTGKARPADPRDVLAGFLRSLGFAPSQIPESPDEAVALFRSYCRDRRVLVVLDDAAGGGQVRTLLPAGPGCVAIVASRFTAADLAVDCAAALEPVPVLAAAEAARLLELLLGRHRATADPAATARLIELCDGLPLALRIAASRLAIRPGWGVRDLVGQYEADVGFLEVLDRGGGVLTTALNATRRRLSTTASRLLPLLALCGPSAASGAHDDDRDPLAEPCTDADTAAALLGTGHDEALAALRNLVAWNLLSEPHPGRFAWPSLVGCYLRRLRSEELGECDVRAVTARCQSAATVRRAARGGVVTAPGIH